MMTDPGPLVAGRTVGIVGVGNMGGAMGVRLLAQGWAVQACDLLPARVQALVQQGARTAATPAEAGRGAGALIVGLVVGGKAQAVLFGDEAAAAALAPGRAVLLCPTIAPQDVEALAARLAGLGLAAIDAPMSGGPARALEGTMRLM